MVSLRPIRPAAWFLALLTSLAATGAASAHIKWFCAYDVAGQPRGLENVLCPDFEKLVGTAILVLVIGTLAEGTWVGSALLRALDQVTAPLRQNTDLLMRAACGFFLVALWTTGGILLTPELKTSMAWVSWMQLAMAAGLLWRRTLPITALGILVLFVLAIYQYGAFHMMDYPIFLGIATYLVLVGLGRDLFGMRPVDVLRWAAAITLMWASIEKWAYPEWTFPLLTSHPDMTLTFDDELFMRAAGVVEFTLSFALVWTPLTRRFGATILAGMFTSAILPFGKIDAIGHAPIIAVMLVIIGDSVSRPVAEAAASQSGRKAALLAPAAYAFALAAVLALYYVVHSMIFGTLIV